MDDAGAIADPRPDGAARMSPDGSGPAWRQCGRLAYPEALEAMRREVEAIRAGTAPEQVWLLEHPPLFTAGTSARPEDLFNPLGLPVFAAGRGGQWTYHGPGQRVAYVMLDLQRRHGPLPPRDVRAFVGALEQWLIRTLAAFGIKGELRPGRVGVWVVDPRTGLESKIAALGVRLTRWVSWHGISLNIHPDLAHFDGIVPCGLSEFGVTSLHALGVETDADAVDAALRASWPEMFGPAQGEPGHQV